MAGRKVAIWLVDQVERELEARGDNRSGTINRDLERLYGLYRRALRRVKLTVEEAMLICAVVQGTSYDANTAPMLWASVLDACKLEGAGESFGVDGEALAQKLRQLDDATLMAIVDAAERALRIGGSMEEAVVKAGLVQEVPAGKRTDN